MNDRTKTRAKAIPPFQSGQVWRMGDSNLEIGLVGKTLVHYKHYKGETKRAPVSLSGQAALKAFLKMSKAVLVSK